MSETTEMTWTGGAGGLEQLGKARAIVAWINNLGGAAWYEPGAEYIVVRNLDPGLAFIGAGDTAVATDLWFDYDDPRGQYTDPDEVSPYSDIRAFTIHKGADCG